jgi:hypothetical protein
MWWYNTGLTPPTESFSSWLTFTSDVSIHGWRQAPQGLCTSIRVTSGILCVSVTLVDSPVEVLEMDKTRRHLLPHEVVVVKEGDEM